MSRVLLWVTAQRRQIATLAIGHLANQGLIILFDYVLYPAAIVWFGVVEGGAIMTILSALICYLLIIFYRWSGRDWLGIELVRALRDGPPPSNRAMRIVHNILKSGQIPALIILSVRYDPFITVIYLRDGTPGRSGLSRRDWLTFWVSVVLSNLWWIGAVSIVIEMVKLLWT